MWWSMYKCAPRSLLYPNTHVNIYMYVPQIKVKFALKWITIPKLMMLNYMPIHLDTCEIGQF